MSHYSDHTHMCLHFYAKEVSHEVFTAIESGVTRARHWGDEVRRLGGGGFGCTYILLRLSRPFLRCWALFAVPSTHYPMV